MLKGPQLRAAEQRKRLQKQLRTLRANDSRAWRELSAIFRIRKGCPLEHQLRHRRFEEAAELVKLGEKCLDEMNHCYALRLAAFRPGDQLLVKTDTARLSARPAPLPGTRRAVGKARLLLVRGARAH